MAVGVKPRRLFFQSHALINLSLPACCQMTWSRYLDTHQTSTEQTCGRSKLERSMLNITYKDRKPNIWVKDRTKVIDIISNVRNDVVLSRTLQAPQRRPMDLAYNRDKKRRQERPAKRWRDDLDKYWSDTTWQRTAQDRLTWRRHAAQ